MDRCLDEIGKAAHGGAVGYPRYYKVHSRLTGLFDVLAGAMVLMLFLVSAITYAASAVGWLIRQAGWIFLVWVPGVVGHASQWLRRLIPDPVSIVAAVVPDNKRR